MAVKAFRKAAMGVALIAIAGACSKVSLAAEYSPYAGDSKTVTQLFWGDTHLHTSLSTDAFGFGVRLGPEEAFRLAAGEEVLSTYGRKVKLSRPLDFLVVADHAESLGMMDLVRAGDERIIGDPDVARWNQLINGSPEDLAAFRREFFSRKGRKAAFTKLAALSTDKLQRAIWQETLSAAEQHNRPGHFTSLLGYEWTSAPGGSNLHRVVVFRDGVEKVETVLPYSSYDSDQPVDLWKYFARYEEKTGGQVMGIPHNGNLSNGLMFPAESAWGDHPVDSDYARSRSRWEPVYEVTQIKGDGEAHPLLSPDDEFADYETWDEGNMEGKPKTKAMLPGEYARSALKQGLALQAALGVNPYRFGMIGSTDSHTGLATAQENNFFGKHSGVEPTADRWKHLVGKAGDQQVLGWRMASSGYAAIWAEENTRAALWDALKRREVYATTGSRISVRFFGGWGFEGSDAHRPDLARVGYSKGVPMGGELSGSDRSGSPSFLVSASKDAIGANLDRVQVVKGWLDDGTLREKVYNIGWSEPGLRQVDGEGRLPPVDTTVELSRGSWANSVGSETLSAVWRDPDFDPAQQAFYYARVLEIPTPRWTVYDSTRLGAKMTEEVPMTTQERAYTSPIWYTP